MIISDLILKNEKLSAQMKIFAEEIDRLEQLRDLFKRNPDQECGPNPNLSIVLNRKLKRAKEQFILLNKAYDEKEHTRIHCCSCYRNCRDPRSIY